MRKYLLIIAAGILLASCGEYQKVLKSSDNNYKFEYAKQAFERKQYAQASTILADLVNVFRTNDKAEETLYLLALSYYENKDYVNAAAYFHNYYTRYPKGKYAELSRFYCGYSYYIDSPEPQLDQSITLKAIKELQLFIEYFPNSDKVAIAQAAIFEMQDKLTLKELQNAQLYYNLGAYMGNNYQAAIIVAQNAIKDYPYSKYKEALELIVLKSRYQEAMQSVDERKADRFREVIDEYYSFITNYPDGENRKEADNIFKIASKYVKD